MVGAKADIPQVHTGKLLDKKGRYVIIKGKVGSQNLVIVGIYTPNWQQSLFGEDIFGLLIQSGDSEIVMMGNFNSSSNN